MANYDLAAVWATACANDPGLGNRRALEQLRAAGAATPDPVGFYRAVFAPWRGGRWLRNPVAFAVFLDGAHSDLLPGESLG